MANYVSGDFSCSRGRPATTLYIQQTIFYNDNERPLTRRLLLTQIAGKYAVLLFGLYLTYRVMTLYRIR